MDGIFLVPFAPFLFVLGIIWLNNNRKLEALRDERPIEQRLEAPELQGRI